ncbi:MAG: amino acid adenylation domain-containing protein [Nostoc sp. LLA-1]|nr:amino acid adenylation domain-containing protein [Cyanocohniella sp. LLY]
MLGILKAGGAYVPLDPTYPKERINFMLSDAQVSAVITKQSLAEKLLEIPVKIVCLDSDWKTLNCYQKENLVNFTMPRNLAYVIYTSGSTGQPKGVAISHQAVSRLVFNNEYISITNSDVVAQVSNHSFDAATFEIWGTLLQGARLVGVEKEVALSPLDFAEYIHQQQISICFLTTALIHKFASEAPHAFNGLRHLLFGGEVADVSKINTLFCESSPQRLLHVYGPTESTTFSSNYLVRDMANTDQNLPIGYPIANTQIYILDRHLQLVMIGVPGEIYIAGDGLARGYFNRPDLTAERFIPNIFSQQPGARLYRTGDLGCYLPDGSIKFLGRIDHQVKLRGFRIELGEIETVLTQHPSINDAIVIARKNVPNEHCLVAYCTTSQTKISSEQLRQFLKIKLPDYMIPAAFVLLPEFPLTPNGKVDRRALPMPDISQSKKGFIPPRDALEQQLVQIWEELLGLSLIGVQDNFFDLGGHSLLTIRLISQIQQKFSKKLSLTAIFQNPTIEQLAHLLRESTDSSYFSPLVAIQPRGSKPPFFCVPGAGGNIIYLYSLARHLGFDQPFYGLQARGLDGELQPHRQIQEIAAYYIESIQKLQPHGPYVLGGHSLGGKIAFEMAQQLQKQGHQVSLLVIFDTNAPYLDIEPVGANWDDPMFLIHLVGVWENFYGKKFDLTYDLLQSMTPDEQINCLKEQLQTLGLLPLEVRTEQIMGLVEVFKAQLQVRYVAPKDVYRTKIALFRAQEIHQDSTAVLNEPAYDWDLFSDGPVDVYSIPGNHISMMTEPHVQNLAERLKACIERIQEKNQTTI